MGKYSVLMTVYKSEEPEFFVEAIESMLAQTIPTDDFVIVCDGPLTPELEKVIDAYTRNYPGLFNILRLSENRGVGYASAQGVLQCRNELIAKMDSDDISHTDRCEIQLKCFEENPKLAVVGGYILEFQNENREKTSVRKVPLTQKEIYKYSKRRSPFNNPTVMYRKSVILDVGNYSDLRRCEDFEIYARILHKGYETMNIPACLLDYRISNISYNKRNIYSYIKQSRKMSQQIGHSSWLDVFISCFAQLVITKMPEKLRQFVYEKLIRRF